MLTFEATKNQKFLLAGVGMVLIIYLIYELVFAPAFTVYSEKKDVDAQLSSQLQEYYQKSMRYKRLKQAYIRDERYLNVAREKLSIDVADLLSLLTQDSPISNFTQASLEKQKKKVDESGVVQYPFQISFQSSFEKIGEYLLYQESALPTSFINTIEIQRVKTSATLLETRITGVIYKVQ